jgi:hypothetical protein
MQPAFVCLPDVTAAYSEAPANLVSAEVQTMAAFYASLGGEWNGELQCPPDSPMTGSVTVSIETDAINQMKVVVGVDKRQIGVDCGDEGMVLAGGQISLSGSSLGGLSGETGSLDARIGERLAKIQFSFDPSFDPGLAAVEGLLMFYSDLVVSGVVTIAQQPTKTSDGMSHQVGVNCPLVLLGRKV